MAFDVVKYQVDFLGGDCNGSIYKYYNDNNHEFSIRDSNIAVILKKMVEAVNAVSKGLPTFTPCNYQLVTATSTRNLALIKEYYSLPEEERGEYPDQDVLAVIAVSWGHTPKPQDSYYALQEHHPEIPEGEWAMHVCETALQLTNRHLWLGPVDQDWHRPLQVNLKPFWARNYQYRTAHSDVQSARRDKYWVDPRGTRKGTWQNWPKVPGTEEQTWEDSGRPWKVWPTATETSQDGWQPPWKNMQPSEEPQEQYQRLAPRTTAASSSSSSGSWRPQLPTDSSTGGPWRQEEKKAPAPWTNRGWNSYT